MKRLALVGMAAALMTACLSLASPSVAAAQATPAPIAAPVVAGCSIFPANDPVFNRDISNAPVDPNSAAYITSYLAVAGATTHLTFVGGLNDWSLNIAKLTDPRYPLVQHGTTKTLVSGFPFLSSYEWQGKNLSYTGDRHLMVLDPATCHYYESYTFVPRTPPSWQVVGSQLIQPSYYGGWWDFTQPYPATHFGSVDAGSVPFMAGMIRPEDIAAGSINHALNIDVLKDALRYMHSVYPARGGEMLPYNGPAADAALSLPLGAHLRIPASYTLSCATACPVTQMVIAAGKKYGFYVMDTETSNSPVLYFMNRSNADGTFTYTFNNTDLLNISRIPFSILEVVAPPNCTTTVEQCMQ